MTQTLQKEPSMLDRLKALEKTGCGLTADELERAELNQEECDAELKERFPFGREAYFMALSETCGTNMY